MCSYCVVPFTRGLEINRFMISIADEVRALSDQGIKKVVPLSQNVNWYHDKNLEGTAEKDVAMYPLLCLSICFALVTRLSCSSLTC